MNHTGFPLAEVLRVVQQMPSGRAHHGSILAKLDGKWQVGSNRKTMFRVQMACGRLVRMGCLTRIPRDDGGPTAYFFVKSLPGPQSRCLRCDGTGEVCDRCGEAANDCISCDATFSECETCRGTGR